MTFLRIVTPLYVCFSMISGQAPYFRASFAFVPRKNRYPLFRIVLWPAPHPANRIALSRLYGKFRRQHIDPQRFTTQALLRQPE
jgi:hypothetical protein